LLVSLERLLGDQVGETVDANASRMRRSWWYRGFPIRVSLKPTVEIELTRADGEKEKFPFDVTLATPLPRPLAAKARFTLTRVCATSWLT
jgi:hypothetical protein